MTQLKTTQLFQSGLYTPSEFALLYRPPTYVAPASRKLVIAVHGHNGSAHQWHPAVIGDQARCLADAGMWVLAIDAGGTQTWNDAAAMTAISAAVAWGLSPTGGNCQASTKVGLIGWSMGGGNSLQWIKENPTKVACAQLWAPLSDMGYAHDSLGYAAEIDGVYAAYGGYSTGAVGRKGMGDGGAWAANWQSKCPIWVIQGDADTTWTPAKSTAFVNGVNAAPGTTQPVTLTTIAGGDHSSIFGSVDHAATVAFFQAGAW